MSAWERGQAPQRRFFAQIAEFTKLPDERAVELLLSGDDADAAEPNVSEHDAPAPRTELQERVVETITDYLRTGRTPSRDLTKLFRDLMAWANQPGEDSPPR